MSYKIFRFKKITNSNGSLVPINLKQFTKFKIKRFFILRGNKNDIRGNHAHKKCSQIFIPINGRTELEIFKKTKKKNCFKLEKKTRNIYKTF